MDGEYSTNKINFIQVVLNIFRHNNTFTTAIRPFKTLIDAKISLHEMQELLSSDMSIPKNEQIVKFRKNTNARHDVLQPSQSVLLIF